VDTIIHLVRHGQVENPGRVIYGRLPGFHLSARGQRQAEAAARLLRPRRVGAIWASPLERAQETAAVIAKELGVSITTDPRLLEAEASGIEGVEGSVRGFLGSPRRLWSARNPLKPTWGESFSDIRRRMVEAISEAILGTSGREVVIVSHHAPLIMARLALSNRVPPPWWVLTPCETGSVTTLVLERGRLLSTSYYSAPRA
jgi:broad specificity phosphatase PhoE